MHTRILTVVATVLALACVGCSKEDDATKQALIKAGFSEKAAAELSGMNMTREEINNVVEARRNGLDETSVVSMVKAMHDEDLTFVIGEETGLLVSAGMSPMAVTQLVQMGAVPRWADDIRALKEFGVDDVTVVEMAKIKFVDKKDILSGGEYARLKQFGMSDAGLLAFARKSGTAQQVDAIAQDLAKGKPEGEAMQAAGIK